MPEWLTIVLALGGSALINLIIGYIGKRRLDKIYKARDMKEQEEAKKEEDGKNAIRMLQEQKLHDDIVSNIKTILAPIEAKIDTLQTKIDGTISGTLSTLRNDILTGYYRCREKGYRNDYDYTNIHDLYDAYKELHGNSFVSDVMQRFDNLPNKEDVKELKKLHE